MKHSIHSSHIFEDPNYVLGRTKNASLDHKQYSFSELAQEAWEKTADKCLYYRRSDNEILADWTNSQVVAEIGLEARLNEMVGYVKASVELPFLALQDCGIVCAEAVDQSLRENYLGLSQWLEFHLLHNVDILLEMNPICRKHYAYRAATFRDVYGLIQDIYASKNELCRWAKAFSPAQLLFCCMIQFCFKDLQQKKILPGGRHKEKTESIQDTFQSVRALSNGPGQVEISAGDEPVFLISPYDALLMTAIKLSQQNIYYVKKRRNPSSYQKYLRALMKDAYYAKNNLQMQLQQLSPNGEKLIYSQRYQQLKSTRSHKTEEKGFVKQC